MELENLKKGDKIYDVNSRYQIEWYKYLCVHPNNSNYHILIDKNEEPVRIYVDYLRVTLKNNLTTYDEAKLFLISKLESKIVFLKEK